MKVFVNRQIENKIEYSDIIAILSKRATNKSAFWLAHKDTIQDLLIMTSPDGNPVFTWGNKVSDDTLLGRAIYFSEDMPEFCIMLIEGNFKIKENFIEIEITQSISL